jgi:hypothetical protein
MLNLIKQRLGFVCAGPREKDRKGTMSLQQLLLHRATDCSETPPLSTWLLTTCLGVPRIVVLTGKPKLGEDHANHPEAALPATTHVAPPSWKDRSPPPRHVPGGALASSVAGGAGRGAKESEADEEGGKYAASKNRMFNLLYDEMRSDLKQLARENQGGGLKLYAPQGDPRRERDRLGGLDREDAGSDAGYDSEGAVPDVSIIETAKAGREVGVGPSQEEVFMSAC